MSMFPEFRIALVLNKELAYWREVLRGILHFSRTQPGWILHSVAELTPSRLDLLRVWQPAGVIAHVLSDEMERGLLSLGTPTVSVSNFIASDRLPRVGVDDRMIGRIVAEHFLTRGLQHFAYFGGNEQNAVERREGFYAAIEAAGLGHHLYNPPPFPSLDMSKAWTSSDKVLAQWLTSLPKPLGLMLSDDTWGLWFTQVCRQADLQVPEEIAIVGVNDDTLNCDLAIPSLSSVGIPKEQIGHSAASLLAKLIAGQSPPAEPQLVPPLGVVTRHSSSVLAVSDPDVAAAVRFIERTSARPLSVEDVLTEVPIARRLLERKFRDVLGRSPLQEIRRAHVERAKQLLVHTDLKLEVVAHRSGFGTMYHLCRVFRKDIGQTPMSYRRQFRTSE